MNDLFRRLAWIWITLNLAACHTLPVIDPSLASVPTEPYGYRWGDPYVATVIGTPPEQQAALPENVPIEKRAIRFDEDKTPPRVFWYQNGMRYAVAKQPGRAPLVVVISGTGGSATSRSMSKLVRVLYAGGYHVLALPSPTHPDFIVNASSTGVPGRSSVDARDLYAVMRRLKDELKGEMEIDGVYLAGYSLGAWNAAFVARLDQEERALDFRKVIMINPPVSLYRSMTILDRMLIENIPGGFDGLPAYATRVINSVANIYASSARSGDFTGNFLYRAYLEYRPKKEALAALIGLSFRLSALDVAFTADVMSGQGYLISPLEETDWSTPLTEYWIKGVQRGFSDYLDGLMFPYYFRNERSLTLEQLVREASLERIQDYLSTAPNVNLITNADDIIYGPGDVSFLRETFSERAVIFPHGGHVGNIEHPQVVEAILTALSDGETP
ncbi:MAG: alpha/beta hydrolase [Hyphomicrobiales bacterium]|nr:alpha/beta hydrolase [Hyphomicrobiales bacterium]